MWLLRYAAVCKHGGYLLVPTATYIEEPISGGHIGCGSSAVREATQASPISFAVSLQCRFM